MTKTEIITMISQNPTMQLATIDETGHPRTRGLLMYSADEHGIIFHTGVHKDLYRQLRNNNNVEASFIETNTFTQIRVSGVAVPINDDSFVEKIVSTPGREFLKPWVEKHGIQMIKPFRIEKCVASIWNMQTNFTYPKHTVQL